MSNEIDFPESTADLPQSEGGSGGGNWPIKVLDVYTTFNEKYGKEGKNGLMVEIETEKNNKQRAVFFPEGNSDRTKALLNALEKLNIAPHMIGGWKNLRGYRLSWTSQEKSFTRKGETEPVKYQVEFPVAVLSAPTRSAGTAQESADAESPFDRLKALGLGKSKSEIKFAVAKDSSLSEFREAIGSNQLINELIDDGVWALQGGKIVQGNSY